MKTSMTATYFLKTLPLILLPLVFSWGCSPSGVAVISATGEITYQGKPVDAALVTFMPNSAEGRGAAGYTDANGKFQLTTQGALTNGCLPGKYLVTVTKNIAVDSSGNPVKVPEEPPSPIAAVEAPPTYKSFVPKKYGNAETSGLEAEVLQKGTNHFVFSLNDE